MRRNPVKGLMPSRRVAPPFPILAGAVSLKFRFRANQRPNISATTREFKALRQSSLSGRMTLRSCLHALS